jgi:NitT/TauT family transport system ATP-binding protein
MTDPATPAIRLAAVRLAFPGGHEAVAGLDLHVAAGEFVALVGPSGCGKSTLLRLVAGLLRPTSGTVDVAPDADAGSGEDGAVPAGDRSGPRTGFVFQEPRLLPWRTAADNVRLPLELAGTIGPQSDRSVADSLELVGLAPPDGGKFPRQLSGGMRMRVSLARALVLRPRLLLLDEPFGALDDILRQQLGEDLRRIWGEQRWTALFVTHNVSEAVFLAQRVVVMTRAPGRIAADVPVPFGADRPPELRHAPEFARLAGDVASRLRGGRA